MIRSDSNTTSPFGQYDQPADSYEVITPEQAKQIMDTEEGYLILDVRNKGEYESCHIEGAACLPLRSILDGSREGLEDKNQRILVYCEHGNRSRQAGAELAADGYTNVMVFGGIVDWPYETIKS